MTGATSGIGAACARRLAAEGHTVLLGARDSERGEETRAAIAGETGNADVHVALADLSLQAHVRALAAWVEASYPRVDVLVNNAGLMSRRRQTTAEGVELTLAVNHLAPFLLTNLLLPRLRRVVTVTSALHARGSIDFDDLQGERRYSATRAYNQSKLANVLFTSELARRTGGEVRAVCAHPGAVASRFYDELPLQPLISVSKRFMVSPAEAGDAVAWLATAEVEDGYYVRRRRSAPSAAAEDPALAVRLWEVSARLTGLAE